MDTNELFTKYSEQWKAAKEFARPIWDRRNVNFALYVGARKKKPKSVANYSVPYVATLVDIVHPVLTNKLPTYSVSANNERDKEASTLGNELLRHDFDQNNFEFKFLSSNKEAMIYDTAWTKVCWKYQDKTTDRASIEQLNTFDVYPHPEKTDLDDDFPLFVRAEMTKAQMKKEGWNEELIDSLGESKLETLDYRKQQLQLLGYTDKEIKDDKKDDLYEVIEVWGMSDFDDERKVGCVIIANGEKVINTDPYPDKKPFESPYNHGKLPFAYLTYNPLPHILLGEGFITPIASLQEELNSLENEKVNNYRRRNNPPLKVRRKGNIDLSTLKFVTALPWLVNEQDDVMAMELPDLAPSIESQQNMIRKQMQDRTGANDVLLVSDDVDVQGGDTATGASIANENVKMRFKPQATLIDLYVQRIGELVLSMYQDPRFFDRRKAIAVADEEGNYYEKLISPEQLKGDIRFRVLSNSSLAESNNAKLTKYMNLKEIYIQDSSVNQDEIDKKIFEAADLDYNKMKRGKEAMLPDLTMKLKQLIAVTQQPGFENAPEAQRQSVLAQIDKMKMMMESTQGMAPEGVM